MADTIELLPAFPGMAVGYDPDKNPFFSPIVMEALKRIEGCPAGKSLLKGIGDAKPTSRADFAAGVNVLVVPQAVSFVQSGFKQAWASGGGMEKTLEASPDPRHVAPTGCPFYLLGGSQNASKDPTAAGNGNGSVCVMYFTNVQVITTKGEATLPYVVLAHELIHSLHCLTGVRKDGQDEELCTTGIGKYASEALSENVIRQQLGLQQRAAYF